MGNVFNLNALRNQVITTQEAGDVKDQLRGLGYDFSDRDFYQLTSPSSKTYKANVLDAYEPKEVPEEELPEEDSYYFYDEGGNAYFFEVDENGDVDPESLIPLIVE